MIVPSKPEFEELIDLHSIELYAYLWRMLGDEHDAEDCLQEVFMRAYRAYENLPSGGNYRAWMYKIATNSANTARKKRARYQNHELLVDLEKIGAPIILEREAQMRETLALVAAEVNALPQRQKAAIILRKYQELTYVEIATTLACSPEAARANVYQGLKTLRAKLRQAFECEVLL